jgi:hypothetical protein
VEPPFDTGNITVSGPYESGFHPRNRSTEVGIIVEVCQLGESDRDRLGLAQEADLAANENLLCGAMVVKVVEPDGCWVEQWVDNEGQPLTTSWVKWRDFCPDTPGWASSHEGISEKPLPLNGEELVSRLDPDYAVGDAIAFPGIMCESTNIWLSKRPGSNGGTVHENDTLLSHWVCVDNSTVVEEGDIVIPDDGTGSAGESVCSDGDSKMADDGCNTCSCEQNQWVCTEIACDLIDDSDGGQSGDPRGGFEMLNVIKLGLLVLLSMGLVTFLLMTFRRPR